MGKRSYNGAVIVRQMTDQEYRRYFGKSKKQAQIEAQAQELHRQEFLDRCERSEAQIRDLRRGK
jgi:phage gp46-like protein